MSQRDSDPDLHPQTPTQTSRPGPSPRAQPQPSLNQEGHLAVMWRTDCGLGFQVGGSSTCQRERGWSGCRSRG